MNIEGIVYVTFPYPHHFAFSDHVVDRAAMARKWCAELHALGWLSICPLLHRHIVLSDFEPPDSTWKDEARFTLHFMDKCDALQVLMFEGWEESQNVKDSISHAKLQQKTVTYVNTDALEEWRDSIRNPRRAEHDASVT